MNNGKWNSKRSVEPWPVWLRKWEHCPGTKVLWVRFPVRAHASVAGLILSPGTYGKQPINVSLPLFLKAMKKKMSLGKDLKKKKKC